MVYITPYQYYRGVDRHARSMFPHFLDRKGKTVFEEDLAADPVERFPGRRRSR